MVVLPVSSDAETWIHYIIKHYPEFCLFLLLYLLILTGSTVLAVSKARKVLITYSIYKPHIVHI